MDKESLFGLVCDLNASAQVGIEKDRLEPTFDAFWPQIESAINDIPAEESPEADSPSQVELFEDLVSSIRRTEQGLLRIEGQMAFDGTTRMVQGQLWPRTKFVIGLDEDVGQRSKGESVTISAGNHIEFLGALASELQLDPEWLLSYYLRRDGFDQVVSLDQDIFVHFRRNPKSLLLTSIPF